jgi:uncharacterized damage-inducible protein DinB
MPDRRTPFLVSGERETLVEFLDYLRGSLIIKVTDLDETSARRSTVPSGTSLLGLIKHLTTVEVSWFQFSFAGTDVTVPADEILPADTVFGAVAAYRAAAQANNQIVLQSELDQLCVIAPTASERLSLRWVLVHMLEETARHAGHADIIREQIDGQTGR